MSKNKLRVGIMVDSDQIPAWAYTMLDIIHGSSYAHIHLIIRNTRQLKPKSLFRKAIDNHNRIAYVLYTFLEEKLFHPQPSAFEGKNIRTLLPEVEYLDVQPKETKFSDYIRDEEIQLIRDANLDVLIRLGFRVLRGEILKVSKYGVWSFHHGDNEINRGSPPGFWEVMQRWPETGAILQILTEDLDAGQVLTKSTSMTFHGSVKRNQNNYFWKSLYFMPRMLESLHKLGDKKFFAEVEHKNRHPDFYSRRLYVIPENLEAIKLIFTHVAKFAHRKIKSLFFYEQWILFISPSPKTKIGDSFWRFKEILPPMDKFWADPHLTEYDGRFHLFIEEYDYSKAKGHIAVLSQTDQGEWSAPEIILEKNYHLSYPFVFEHKNKFYMIPESEENGTIQLYQCKEFPHRWEFVMNLMEGVSAVDATVHYQAGKWWMFTNICKHPGTSHLDELYLFYSDELLSSNWIPHPMNPIISDVKSSRPAGRLFSHNGSLYRPSQNSAYQYGYGMKINHVTALTELEYREVEISSIEPMWNPAVQATHSISFAGGLTVIDGLVHRSRILRTIRSRRNV